MTADAHKHRAGTPITAHPTWQLFSGQDRTNQAAAPAAVNTAGLAKIQSACCPKGDKPGLADEGF